jgi:hypothetical protein
VPAPDEYQLALKVWNYLGGLEWQGLDVAVEKFGIIDVERLIDSLVAMRDFQARKLED